MRAAAAGALRLGAALLALVLASCSATYDEKMAEVRGSFYVGNLPVAEERLGELIRKEGDGSYHSCLLLDEAIVRLASGQAERAEANLREVRDEFDRVEEAEVKAFFGEMATYFTDDRSKAYGGEDYEKLLVRVMLAFSNLLRGGEDAVAYANQVLEKQRQILDQEAPDRSGRKYKSGYRLIGAGAYLYGVITEARDVTASGEARISYQRVKEWEPQFTAIDADLERAESGRRLPDGHGVLYVFAFLGKGPVKREVVEQNLNDIALVSEIALQMVRFIPEVGKYYGPTLDLSPIKIHRIDRDPTNTLRSAAVSIDGQLAGETETLTDVTEVATQHYGEGRPWTIAKAVVRRMVKKAVVTGVKGTGRMLVEKNSSDSHRELSAALFEIGGILANTIWSAVERADTRLWSLLPDKIQVLRLELPAGEREVALTPREQSGLGGVQRSVGVRIRAGQNTYVFGFMPSAGPGPALLTTEPASAAAPQP